MKALIMASGYVWLCESWTSKKDDEKRINAFEMKCNTLSWTAKRTNEWVSRQLG